MDDWAYCKGQRYGTLIVDLERHTPIELLQDREADTLATWLKAHPSTEVKNLRKRLELMTAIQQRRFLEATALFKRPPVRKAAWWLLQYLGKPQ